MLVLNKTVVPDAVPAGVAEEVQAQVREAAGWGPSLASTQSLSFHRLYLFSKTE